MNRDDIIRMALEAGFLDRKESSHMFGQSRFDEEICVEEYAVGELVEHFAALVAAHEREACAKECETLLPSQRIFDHRYYGAVGDCVATIRARGEK